MNIAAFLTLLAVALAIGYLVTGTKLLKFIQFFLTKKQYKRLNMSLKPELKAMNVQQNPFETGEVVVATPRSTNAKTVNKTP